MSSTAETGEMSTVQLPPRTEEPDLALGITDRSSVLRGGLWSAASQVVPAAGTAVLSVAAGRLLGCER